MAIARVQFAKDGSTAAVISRAAVFGSDVTAGNLLVVAIRKSPIGGGTITSIVDTLGTVYTLDASNTTRDPHLFLYSGVATASGANTVTVTLTATATFFWVGAVEVSGLLTATLDTSEDTLGTGITDIVADAISTTVSDTYLLLAVSQAATTNYTVGADFTLIDGQIGSGASHFGGMEDRIPSALLSSYVAHITSGVTNNYTVVIGAYKGTANPAHEPLSWLGGAQIAGAVPRYSSVPSGSTPPEKS